MQNIMLMKRKHADLSLASKIEIINEIDSGQQQKAVAEKFGVDRTTITKIMKKKDELQGAFQGGANNPTAKRQRQSSVPHVDAALLRWFKHIHPQNIGITGLDLQRKAMDLARQLGMRDVEISLSWINRWKQRHNVGSKTVCGESESVKADAVNYWLATTLSVILAEFAPSDIFNSDETGLFWCTIPKHKLTFKGQQCKGGKQSKARITVLVAASMAGEKLPVLVIGRSAKPRCFQGWKHLPTLYTSQRKAWMTSELFDKLIRDLDKKMAANKRRIALILDNCPAHPHIIGLRNITLFFLPPGTTSVSQPMDAGVIWSFKSHYRRILIEKRISAFDLGQEYTPSLIDALLFLRTAWERVTEQTIVNCFRKAFPSAFSAAEEIGTEPEELGLFRLQR